MANNKLPSWDDTSPVEQQQASSLPSWEETTPHTQEEPITKTQSAFAGAAKGVTSLVGGAPFWSAAPQAFMNYITGHPFQEGAVDAAMNEYRGNRDRTREGLDKAEKANPKSFMAGEIGGGIVPIALTAGAAAPEVVAGEGAAEAGEGVALNAAQKQLVEQATKKTLEEKMLAGAAQGAKYGAAAGYSNSAADMTHPMDNLGQAVSDTEKGAAGGAVLGGGLAGIGHGLGAAKDYLAGTTAGKIFSKEAGGTDLSDLGEHAQKVGDLGEQLVGTVQSTKQGLQQQYSAIMQGIDDSGASTDISEAYKKYLGQAMKLQENSNPGEGAYETGEQIKNFILDRLQGREQAVPGSQSGLQKLQAMLAKAQDNLETQGQQATSDIQPVDLEGQKMLRGQLTTNEPAGTEMSPPKVRGSWENDVKGDQQARKLIAKLQSKAQIEGTDPNRFSITHDQNNGFFHVVENAADDGAGGSGSVKNFYTPDTPEVPASVVRKGGRGGDLFPSEMVDLKHNAQDLLKTTDNYRGQNIIKQLLGDVNDELPESYRNLDSKYQSVSNAEDALGADGTDYIKNPTTGQDELSPSAYRKMVNLIRQSATSENTTQQPAARQLNQGLDALEDVNPDAVKELRPQIQEAGENLDLSRKVNSAGLPNKLSMLAKAPNKAAQYAGKVANKVGNELGYFKNVASWPAEKFTQIADAISADGEGGQKIANVLREAANKDGVGRNALIFTLMQNPGYRDIINKYSGTGYVTGNK